jgi:hypothetical protein
MLSRVLYRRTRHIAIRAEHAAVTRERLEDSAAALAIVEKLAGIGRHCFRFPMSTMRTCDCGLKLHCRGRAPYLTLAG